MHKQTHRSWTGNLVTINNAAENQWLTSNIKALDKDGECSILDRAYKEATSDDENKIKLEVGKWRR